MILLVQLFLFIVWVTPVTQKQTWTSEQQLIWRLAARQTNVTNLLSGHEHTLERERQHATFWQQDCLCCLSLSSCSRYLASLQPAALCPVWILPLPPNVCTDTYTLHCAHRHTGSLLLLFFCGTPPGVLRTAPTTWPKLLQLCGFLSLNLCLWIFGGHFPLSYIGGDMSPVPLDDYILAFPA